MDFDRRGDQGVLAKHAMHCGMIRLFSLYDGQLIVGTLLVLNPDGMLSARPPGRVHGGNFSRDAMAFPPKTYF